MGCRLMADEKRQNWFRTGWRPAMMWQYFAVCIFDFMVAPTFSPVVLWALGFPYHAWQPLTLQGGGLYHISMGAIGGVAVWTRSQELQTPFRGGRYSPRRDADDVSQDDGRSLPVRSSRAD